MDVISYKPYLFIVSLYSCYHNALNFFIQQCHEITLNYYILRNEEIDLKSIEKESQAGQKPRFDLGLLCQRLGANFEVPKCFSISLQDKLRSKIAGAPEIWAWARVLASQLGPDDLIFCNAEDLGIPLATLCGAKQDRPKIAVLFHNIVRPRGRVALKLFRLVERIDLFIVHSRPQLNFLRSYLNVPDSRVLFLWYSIDGNFLRQASPHLPKNDL